MPPVIDCCSRRRAARAMSCDTAAPDSSTSSHTSTSFSPASTLSICGSRPMTTSARPRLSALVSACSRV